MKPIKLLFVGAYLCTLSPNTIAQIPEPVNLAGMPKREDSNLKELKLTLNKEGTQYIKFIFWNQIWVRHIENNPGTLVNNQPEAYTTDFTLRRIRGLAFLNLSSRYRLITHAGMNNQSFNTGGLGTGTGANGAGKRPQFYVIDAYNEFTVIPERNIRTGEINAFTMAVGAGLHGWNGVSRLYNGSTISTLTLDISLAPPIIDQSDQFGRQLGVFAQGRWKDVAYRFAANRPFATNLTPEIAGPAVDNNSEGNLSYSGYMVYNFLETERQDVSVFSQNYLGTKKVFNLGAGFYNASNATVSQPTEGVFEHHPITILGIDAYLDIPTGQRGAAFTAYAAYSNYRMGPDYLRLFGMINTGVGDPNYTGQREMGFGNSQTFAGTGDSWYLQTGYLLPDILPYVRLQPFSSVFSRDFEAVNERGNTYQFGLNFLIDQHRAKVILQYDNRPMYDNLTRTIFKRGSEYVIGTQISF